MPTPSSKFTFGVDIKGKLFTQEDNLEPVTIKELANYLLCNLTAENRCKFQLAAGATDLPVSFGTITSARGLAIFTNGNITFKVNSLGSQPVPCNPYALFLADNGGITELFLTNLGTAVDVVVWVGA